MIGPKTLAPPRVRGLVATVVGASLLGGMLVGCSSSHDEEVDASSLAPATVPVAPSTSVTASGNVELVGRTISATIVDPVTGTTALLVDEGTHVLLFDAGQAPLGAPRDVGLSTPATSMSGTGEGRLLLASDGAITRVDMESGDVTTIDVGGTVNTAVQLVDGRIAAGMRGGDILIIDPEVDPDSATDPTRITGLSDVDVLAVHGSTLTALDRAQTSVTEVKVDETRLGLALRAGIGASAIATDSYGRLLVTDTLGTALLVYSTDSLMLRQRFPVDGQPYAVAYNEVDQLVWVTLPGSNEVVGYDLSTGVGVEKGRFATVRAPNSLAVDRDGNLLVGSATGDGLQRIPTGRS